MLLTMAAVAVGCGADSNSKNETPAEFYAAGNATYYDADAEMDTLSYAIGMQIGMDNHLRQGYLNLDLDVVLDAVEEGVAQKTFDVESIRENMKNMEYFMMKRIQPYQIAAMFMGPQGDESMLPAIYDDTYNVEEVSRWYGYDVANYLMRVMAPLNMYWVYEAIKDSANIESFDTADSVMAITTQQMQASIQKYMFGELGEKVRAMSDEWLADVSGRNGVQMALCGDDTLYYRIDVPGDDTRLVSLRDSVQLGYDVYTFRGYPVESTAERAARYYETAEEMRRDTVLSDSLRNARVEQTLAEAARVEAPFIKMENMALKGAIEGMKQVGIGGEVTIYIPGSLAYGSTGCQVVVPDEAIYMRVSIKDIKPQSVDLHLAPAPGTSRVITLPANMPTSSEAGKAPVTPVSVQAAE